MFEADMQGVLTFLAVQREVLRAARKEQCAIRIVVENVPRLQAGSLNAAAIRKIGRRQQSDGLLPVAGKGLLRKIVGMDRRRALGYGSFRVEGRIVIIDARQNGRGEPENHVLDAQSGRDRPSL